MADTKQKNRIEKLLSEGLTGEEAGKLIIQDSLLVDRGEEGFLTDRDISTIKSSLKKQEDIQAYNNMIETYRIMDFTLKEAHILALEAQNRLKAINTMAMMYMFDATSELEMRVKPVIMTEKQYKDRKAEQRETLLQDLHSLDEVLESRAFEVSKDIRDEYPEDINIIDFLRDSHPDLYQETIQSLVQVIQEGKLKALEAEKAISQLQSLQNGTMSEDDIDDFCSGEALYQAGLPEWIEWIDEYHPGLDYPDDRGVAILVDPKPSQVDERGHYKAYKRMDLSKVEDQDKLADAFQAGMEKVKEELKAFLAFQAIIEAVSKALDADFDKDVHKWYESVMDIVEEYNDHVKRANVYSSQLMPYKVKESLPSLSIARLRPTKKTLSHLEERMSITLGDNWWQDVKDILRKDLEEKEVQDG